MPTTDAHRREESLDTLADAARYRRLVELSPDVLYVYSVTRGGVYYSPGARRLLGRSIEHLCSHPFAWQNSVHPQDRPIVAQAVEDARTGKAFDIHYRLRHADGDWRWVHDRSLQITADAGDVQIEGLVVDVTERMTMEAERNASEARRHDALAQLEKVASHVPGLIYQFQRWPDGRMAFPFASQDIQQIYGIHPDEARADASGVVDLIHPEDRAAVIESVDESERTLALWKASYRVVLPDGRRMWLEGEATPERQPDGSTVWNGYLSDVTVRKQSEVRLRQLSLAVEQSPESIVITDLDAEIVYVNETFLQKTGYAWDEAIGRNPRLLQSGKTPASTFMAMWTALTAGQTWRGELVNRRKDGTEYLESASISPLRQPDGRVTHYVSVKEDVTERRRVEEELEQYHHHLEQLVEERTRELAAARDEAQSANVQKSVFLANMSHEIRTPLNAIIGFTDVVAAGGAGPINAEQSTQLGMVSTASRHLLALISDVLDISKIEAGQLNVDCEAFDLAAVVRLAVETLRQGAAAKSLALEIDLPPGIDQVLGDERRVYQVMINLLSNAIKFTERGSIRVHGSIVDGNAEIRVTDTGVGIAAEDQVKLFRPFQQVGRWPTRRSDGVGLGLAISRRLIELQGGHVWMESAAGAGSSFGFTLPMPPVPASA